MSNIVTAIAIRLDAYAVVGSLEEDPFSANVLCSSGDFAPHREAVAV